MAVTACHSIALPPVASSGERRGACGYPMLPPLDERRAERAVGLARAAAQPLARTLVVARA